MNYNCLTNLSISYFIVVSDDYLTVEKNHLCIEEDDTNSTLRNTCDSDEECLQNGRQFCEGNPDCYGIAWYDDPPEYDQAIKYCKSQDNSTRVNKGWSTQMKIGNDLAIKSILLV